MEELSLTYKQAQNLVGKYISNPITKLHLRETEVIMKAIAERFNQDQEKWGIIGLLHDIDWDLTKENPSQHCIKSQKILKEAGASDFLINTIISHGYSNELIPDLKEKKRSSKIEYCLAAAETLTGIIIATTLVQPDKKIKNISLRSLKKKFKSKSFAANCNRNIILESEKAGIPLDDFLQIGLSSLQSISDEIGL